MSNRRKLPRRVQILLSTGSVLTSSTFFLHTEFPAMPDFLLGAAQGIGIGIMLSGFIALKRSGRGLCSTDQEKTA